MEIPSKILENAVHEISKLPGIGRSTALRLALNILSREENEVENLTLALNQLKKNIKLCSSCYNLSDLDLCSICSSNKRNKSVICVVEDIRDVMAIENTNQFNGLYHVLGGKISPIEGIGPNKLKINELIERISKDEVSEVIFALSATMEGDTTSYFIFKKIKSENISFSTISRGISVGDDLQYADEITLGKSIINRIPYNQSN